MFFHSSSSLQACYIQPPPSRSVSVLRLSHLNTMTFTALIGDYDTICDTFLCVCVRGNCSPPAKGEVLVRVTVVAPVCGWGWMRCVSSSAPQLVCPLWGCVCVSTSASLVSHIISWCQPQLFEAALVKNSQTHIHIAKNHSALPAQCSLRGILWWCPNEGWELFPTIHSKEYWANRLSLTRG